MNSYMTTVKCSCAVPEELRNLVICNDYIIPWYAFETVRFLCSAYTYMSSLIKVLLAVSEGDSFRAKELLLHYLLFMLLGLHKWIDVQYT